MIKFRYKRKPAAQSGAEKKQDTNVLVSTCKNPQPSEGLHKPVRSLSPDPVIITAEQQETFLSCVRAVVVSFLSQFSSRIEVS